MAVTTIIDEKHDFESRPCQHVAGQAPMEVVMRVAGLVLVGVVSFASDGIASSDGGVSSPSYPNLGFEDWFTSWDCYRAYVDYPTFGCDSIQIASDVVYSGTHSLRASHCWSDTAFANMARASLTDKRYLEISWYERSIVEASCCRDGWASADVTFYDKAGKYAQWTWSFSTSSVERDHWVRHRVKVPIPKYGKYAEFAVFPAITGDYYLDEIVVQQTDDPTGCTNPVDGKPCG
jgi:hypothetical protein